MNSKEWINDFVEKLTRVEGNFDIIFSLFLKYEHQYVFGIQDRKEWAEEQGKLRASIFTLGGQISGDIDIINFLKSRCREELKVDVTILDSPHTYLDYQRRLKKIPINLVKGDIRPQMITIVQKAKYTTTSNLLIFSYIGSTNFKPQPVQYSALFLARESILVQMFKKEKTVGELKQAGANFEERIKIPENLFLYPTGSVNSLLRFLSYETY